MPSFVKRVAPVKDVNAGPGDSGGQVNYPIHLISVVDLVAAGVNREFRE
jgi:hypothetical protein